MTLKEDIRFMLKNGKAISRVYLNKFYDKKNFKDLTDLGIEAATNHPEKWLLRLINKRIEANIANMTVADVSKGVNLYELERKLDEALSKETRETLIEWIKLQKQQYEKESLRT